MVRRQNGFSMVELMITMVIFVFVIASASQIFSGLLSQFKQQSRITETNIEGIVGLDIMRRDMEHAGYGIPWDLNGAVYEEAENFGFTSWDDSVFNDGPPGNPERGVCTNTDCPNGSPLSCNPANCSNPPAAFRSGAGEGMGDSDILVIKSTTVARVDDAAQKWTYVNPGNSLKFWDDPLEDMITSDRVIVLVADASRRLIVVGGGRFTSRYDRNGGNPRLKDLSSSSGSSDNIFAPPDDTEMRIVYGVTNPASPVTAALRMPFNRADYYVRRPGTMPVRCAENTGILYKATVSQPSPNIGIEGGGFSELPLLDCVADMQIIYWLDTNGDGTIDETRDGNIEDLTAEQIRTQMREVRVYILAHEGQKDPNFTFANYQTGIACATCIRVGMSASFGRDFNLATVPDHQNYRWKVYTIAVQPANLR